MRDIGTTHLPANERILSYLERHAGIPNFHDQIVHAIETTVDGVERRDEITVADLQTVLAERREAIERLSALTADARLYLGNSGKPLHPARMGDVREDFDASIGSQEAWLFSIESDA